MEDKATEKAKKIYQKMMEEDQFTKWLGMELDHLEEGRCTMHYTLRPEMMNGFQTAHGGVLFSASDSVFAFICNSHGRASVALDVSINFLKPGRVGDRLTVIGELVSLGNKVGTYEIKTINQDQELVCIFHGTSYRTSKEWEIEA